MLCTDPKKHRIADYNDQLKDFLNALNQANDLAIRYWSYDGQMNELEGFLISAKTECNRLATAINRKRCELYNFVLVAQKTSAYFQVITGDTFRQENRKSDTRKLDEADLILKELKDSIESSKVSYTIKNIALLKLS